jgi:type IV pilus assembly protein PilC
MGRLSADLGRQVSGGIMLSRAFAAHSQAFSQLQIRMLAVGERTGNLHLVLGRLATYEEKRRATTMKVKSALTYPMFLVGLASFMLIVLPPYMFGGLFQMIASSGVEPPLLTRLVMTISDFIRTPWFWLALSASLVAIVKLGPRVWERPRVRHEVYQKLLRAPVFGLFLPTLATARFARALELQMQVGESPLLGLKMACAASGNPVLEDCADEIVSSLKGGETIVDSLKVTKFFPRTFLDMVRAGEESAHLPEMLERSANMYETDLDHAIDRFTAPLEPLIMLVMGIIVGIMVVATMLPMMTLIQKL